MASVLDRLRAMGEAVARELGFELVQVQLAREGGERFLRFLLDKPGGITIGDCESFSRQIDPLLDSADPLQYRYTLEVSSAGLDRPLFREADYERFAGRLVTIGLHRPVEGRRRFRGKLLGLTYVAGEALVGLETEGGGRMAIPLSQIAQARLVPDL